ncbi:MAG: hypothetical protein ACI83D_000291 [Planctomycetota bacterium]|jgi:hypothetical protein
MHNTKKTFLVAGVFIVLLLLLLNPFGWWMSSTLITIIVIGVLIVFSLYSGLFFREKINDERELAHSGLAARVSYMVTHWALVFGIIIQAIQRDLDIFLISILILSIVAKLCARIYYDRNH